MTDWLKQSTAVTKKIGPFLDDTDGKTAETGLTIAQSDIRLSKNGGAFAQTHNSAGATHDENGFYGVPLDTTDTGTLGGLRVAVSKSGALPVWQDFMVVPANVWDSMFGADYLQVDAVQVEGVDATDQIRDSLVDDATRIDASALNTLSGHDPGETIMGATDLGTGAGFTSLASSAELAKVPKSDSTVSFNATALAAIADGVWDEATSGHTGAGTSGKALTDANNGTPPSASAIADAVWDEVVTTGSHDTATFAGAQLLASNNGTPPAASAIADAVWDEALTGHTDSGKAGKALSDADNASAIAALNDLSSSDVGSAVGTALGTYNAAQTGDAMTLTSAYDAAKSAAQAGDKMDLVNAPNATAVAAIQSGLSTFDPGTDVVAEVTLVDTCTTNTDMVDPAPLAADVADAVWDEALAGHAGAGSAGLALAGASAPSAASVADAVWDEALTGHTDTGKAGAALNAAGSAGDPWAATGLSSYGAGTAGKTFADNLDAKVSTRLATTGYTAPDNAGISANGAAIAALNDLSVTDVAGELTTYGAAKPGDAMTLTSAYDAAKSAASPANVASALSTYDAPTKAELDAGLGALNDLSSAEAQSAAAAALAAYDPPTKAEMDSGIAGIPAAPSASAVATAVWGAVTRTLSAFDFSVDVDVDEAAIAAAVVEGLQGQELIDPDEVAAAIVGLLGALQVTVTSPVASDGTITVYEGDSYDVSGFTIDATISAAGVPSLTGATIVLKTAEAAFTATSVTSDGTDWTIVWQPTSLQTAALTPGSYSYEIEATLAAPNAGKVRTLQRGIMTIVKDIPTVSSE